MGVARQESSGQEQAGRDSPSKNYQTAPDDDKDPSDALRRRGAPRKGLWRCQHCDSDCNMDDWYAGAKAEDASPHIVQNRQELQVLKIWIPTHGGTPRTAIPRACLLLCQAGVR